MTPARASGSFSSTRGIFLVGFMGCGKTSVGELLSRRLGWRFEDLDRRIESRQRCQIATIFSNQGEARFRLIEREALLELIPEMASSPTVAALGGGALVEPENRRMLEDSGIPAIFLDGRPEDLWRRCQQAADERPLARDKNQFRQLYEARRSLYMKAAVRIDTTGKTVGAVSTEVASWLEKALAEEE